METFGPLFANAGFSIEETNAVFGQLEQAGISITRLGPGLNKFFRDMAAEGKDPKEALAAVVEEMQNAGTSAEALTLATAAFGAEGAQRMTTAVRSGNFDLKDFNGLLGEGTGLVGEQANATETFGQKWAVVKNRVFVALEPLATKLFNAIKVGMDAIGPAIETVSRLFVIFKEDGIEGLSAAIEQKFGPNSVVTRTFKAFVTFFEDAQKVISEEVVPRIKGALEALSNIINGILIAIMALWDVFGDTILDAITDTFEFIKSAIDAALKIIKGIVDTFIGIFTGDWQLAWDGIKSIFKGIVDSFAAVFTFAWERLKTVVRLGLNAIRALWNLGFLQAGVRRAIDAVVTYFRKLPGRLRSLTKAVFRAAKSVGAKVVSGIISGIRGGIGAVASIATTIANSLVTIINTKIIDNINRALEFRIELFGVGRDINPPDIPHIPGLATGGIMGRGGNVVVGERGKEIVSLPAGARVEPNHGARMDEGGGITVNVQTQADPFQIANAIAWRMRTRGA